MPASFVYGQVTLEFAFEGRSAKAVIKYRYYAQDKRIEYESIECADEKLKERIEKDPAMREKVNGYVSQVLAKRNEGLS